VEVGLQGFRNGWDASMFMRDADHTGLTSPQGTCFVNPRGVSRLRLYSEEES